MTAMSKPTGYVVSDDGTMRAVYDYGLDSDTVTQVAQSGRDAFRPAEAVEPDLEAIAAASGVDLDDIADLDDKLAEVGSSLEVVAQAAGVTETQVRAVVLLLAGLASDEDSDEKDDGDDNEVEVVGPEIGQNGPDPAGAQPTDTVPDYPSFSKKQLEDEVKLRNSERKTEDVDYIVVDAPGNKPELIAALVADDQVED